MKKFFVSTGLVALGAASLQSACAAGLDVVSPKAWSVSGTLRGFYDDNYNISSTKKGSWGLEVSPQVAYNLPLQQSDIGIRYIYGLYYYNDRDSLGLNPFDQTHQVDVWLNHAINERWKINFADTFAVGQEPELLQTPAVPYRVNGNNIANHAHISLDTQWTREFSTSLFYGNDYYDYQNDGSKFSPGGFATESNLPINTPGRSGFNQFTPLSSGLSSGPSLTGLLDRDEQNMGINFQWTFSPETMVFVGYTFSLVNYLGNEPIAIFNYIDTTPAARSLIYGSDSRNSLSHEGHVGISHQLTANLSFMGSVGAAYTDSYNDPLSDTTSVSPTANISLTYTYIPGSYVQFGVSQGENSTDVVQPGPDGNITQYQYTTAVYADLNHHITEKLTGTLIGQFQYSRYKGGAADGMADYDYSLGLNFNYQISRHFSAEAGYNFDDLVSGLAGRQYTRNRVYLGMTASY